MSHPRLSVNSLSSHNWSLDQELALTRDLGLGWIGLVGAKLEPDVDGNLARLAEAGLRLSTVIAGGFDLAAPESWMERDFREVALSTAPHLALVQICDMPIGRPAGSSQGAPGGRVPPGEGELPLERLLRDVIDTGYAGPIELELPGPLGDSEGYEAVIRRGVASAMRLFAEARI